MTVERSIRKGTWSEVVLVSEDRIELGRLSSQERLMKTLSSHSKVGVVRLLDQVKFLSKSGSSIRFKSSMHWLKASASEKRKLALFFS